MLNVSWGFNFSGEMQFEILFVCFQKYINLGVAFYINFQYVTKSLDRSMQGSQSEILFNQSKKKLSNNLVPSEWPTSGETTSVPVKLSKWGLDNVGGNHASEQYWISWHLKSFQPLELVNTWFGLSIWAHPEPSHGAMSSWCVTIPQSIIFLSYFGKED